MSTQEERLPSQETIFAKMDELMLKYKPPYSQVGPPAILIGNADDALAKMQAELVLWVRNIACAAGVAATEDRIVEFLAYANCKDLPDAMGRMDSLNYHAKAATDALETIKAKHAKLVEDIRGLLDVYGKGTTTAPLTILAIQNYLRAQALA